MYHFSVISRFNMIVVTNLNNKKKIKIIIYTLRNNSGYLHISEIKINILQILK